MRILSGSLFLVLIIIFFSGCGGKGSVKKDTQAVIDTVSVTDTGYTGIKKYMSGLTLVKEVTFKNGVREGLMKSFYQTGEVRQTFLYRNGLREDSARWYYQEGQVFRSTPYKNDTIDGIQKQYYRNGRLKAKIGYIKGLRTPYIQEFTTDGKLVGGYPKVVTSTRDEYSTKGAFHILLELSDKATQVKFYRGEMANGVFDTAHYKIINTIKGVGHLDLKKTGTPGTGYVGIVAEIVTNYGNNYLVYKKIDLPYKDLN